MLNNMTTHEVEIMAKKKIGKKGASAAPAVLLKKPEPQKKSPKTKPRPRLDIEKLRELMKTRKPPQSWYDEDHTGLY